MGASNFLLRKSGLQSKKGEKHGSNVQLIDLSTCIVATHNYMYYLRKSQMFLCYKINTSLECLVETYIGLSMKFYSCCYCTVLSSGSIDLS